MTSNFILFNECRASEGDANMVNVCPADTNERIEADHSRLRLGLTKVVDAPVNNNSRNEGRG